MSANTQQSIFSISAVSNMTGVNSVTLRAWERRYGLIQPNRKDSGHRLYSKKDIENIKNILSLLDQGVAISRVKDAMQIAQTNNQDEKETHWTKYRNTMLRGISNFDENYIDNIYSEAMSLYPVDIVTKELLLPLLDELGRQWINKSTGVAEEHFFSNYMRNKLGARFHHQNNKNTGPLIITACLPGEHHEFGLLLLSLAIHAHGYRIILLGADMPLKQLTEVVKISKSEGIILSGSLDSETNSLVSELQELVTESNVPVCVGGKISETFHDKIYSTGAHPLGHDLSDGLNKIIKIFPINSSRSKLL